MKSFTIICSTDGTWHVHKMGRKDLARERKEANNVWEPFEAEDARDAVNRILDKELREMGWSENDVTVYPCAE